MKTGANGCLCGLFLMSICLWGCFNEMEVDEVSSGRVTFMDVGQGLAVLFEQDGKYAMYDMGRDSMGVLDSLRVRGVDTLEWVVLSHNHRDHGGSFLEMTQGVAPFIRRLYVGPDTSGGFVRDSALQVAALLKIPVDTLFRGDELALGNLSFKVRWPASFVRVADNGASLVLQVFAGESQEASVLLTGDLDSAAENRLLSLSPYMLSDLLQVGHHGSASSSSLTFLTRVAPRLAVISVGSHNEYGHPTESVLRKLQYVLGDSTAISRTDLDGSVTYQIVPRVGAIRE